MKKVNVLSLSALFLLLNSSLFAQTTAIKPCGTYNAMEKRFENDPQAKMNFEASQIQLKSRLDNFRTSASKTAAFQYTIPVVFHVLHTGGNENISDATCLAALAQVNADYARTGPDANTVAAPFQSLYINSDIKFMIAKKDPNGNCTSGITHRYDTRTDWSSTNTSYSGITWDPTKYLNIIVTKIIDNGQLIGYTWLPGTWPAGSDADCIVYVNGFLGGLNARSLSHEIGHWLNLPHTFGNTNDPGQVCGDDGIGDTPATKGTYACPSSLTGNVCDVSGIDNVENFMNYSSCPKNFTTDQTNVMRATLAANVSSRDNLWSPANLTATGVNGTASCAPICDFLSTNNNYTVCSGTSLTMKDFSYNGVITSYSWTASNASVINPTASITNVSFPTPGTSIVTLTVSNGQGTSTKSRTITVLNGAPGVPNNYGESFEVDGLPPGWSVTNPNNGTVTWDQTSLAASMGSKSYYMNAIAAVANQYDYLNMPVIDVLNNPTNVFNFKYAFARHNVNNNDQLKIQASTNCGGTWQDIVVLSAATMANQSGGVDPNPYIPLANHWKLYDVTTHPNWVNLAPYSSVMIRFAFVEDLGGVGFGNRLYIDEINFGDPNGMKEQSTSALLSVFPNPSNGDLKLRLKLDDESEISYTIYDIIGKLVYNASSKKLSPGTHELSVNELNALAKGMYQISMKVNGAVLVKKLIIE